MEKSNWDVGFDKVIVALPILPKMQNDKIICLLIDNAVAIFLRLAACLDEFTSFVDFQARIHEAKFEFVEQEASGADLSDPKILCVNSGGYKRVEEEDYQRWYSSRPDLCASAQVFRAHKKELVVSFGKVGEIENLVRFVGKIRQTKSRGMDNNCKQLHLWNLFSDIQFLMLNEFQQKKRDLYMTCFQILICCIVNEQDPTAHLKPEVLKALAEWIEEMRGRYDRSERSIKELLTKKG